MSLELLDPPAPALSERELARRRAHLRSEIDYAAVRGARPPRLRLLAVAATLAVAAAVLAAVLPDVLGGNRMSLVDQALAAIGNRPTIHVVLDYGRRPRLVDLRTGRTVSVDSRVEIWSDPKLGTLWIRTLDGRVIGQYKGGRGLGGPGADDTWKEFVNGYRAQLRNGSYHAVGRGTVAGQPVEWVAGRPIVTGNGKKQVEEIAISRTTYKPLALRWRVDGVLQRSGSARVLVAETLPRSPALYAAHGIIGGGSTSFRNSGRGIRTTLKAARAAMSPDPVVPPLRLAGLSRSWIGEPQLLLMPANSYRDQVGGVLLYYGRLDQWGVPDWIGPFVAVTEVADRLTARRLWGPGLFRAGYAVVQPSPFGRSSVTLKIRGVYVLVEASSRAKAVAAARAIARAG